MKIIAVLAMTEDLLVGDSWWLPWHIPEDLKHFQEITKHQIVIMGKKTFDSLPEQFRPLPNRRNIILSRTCQNNIESYQSIENCITSLKREGIQTCYVIGWAYIYNQFFQKGLIDIVECTLIAWEYSGDIYVDEWRDNFLLTSCTPFSQWSFCVFEKRSS